VTQADWDAGVEKDRIVYEGFRKEFRDGSSLTDEAIDKIMKGIFDLGFSEGQQYVWFMRSGFGREEKVPEGTMTISVPDGDGGGTYVCKDDGTLEKVNWTETTSK